MKPDEKFDNSIKNIVLRNMEHPSPGFTDHVLEKLGVRKALSPVGGKPILSKWSKIAIAAGYLIIMGLIIFFTRGESAVANKYLDLMPKFQLPSLTSLFNFNNQLYSILAIVIGAGWLLILMDNFIKKFLAR